MNKKEKELIVEALDFMCFGKRALKEILKR